tara:strand:+ start:355 stop:585 length:231 start_codon:yes stop_codon:yes gene_type:complete
MALGMWQPRRKDGKNWEVLVSYNIDGESVGESKRFRVQKEARHFIAEMKRKATETKEFEGRVNSLHFKTIKIMGRQ